MSNSAGPTEISEKGGPGETISDKGGPIGNSEEGGPTENSNEGGSQVDSADEGSANVRHRSDSVGGMGVSSDSMGVTGNAVEAHRAQSMSSTDDSNLVDLVSAGVDDGKPAPAPHAPSPESKIQQAETGQQGGGDSKISAASRGRGEETGSDDDMTCEDAERLLRQDLGAGMDTSSAAQTSGPAASPSTTGDSTCSISLPWAAESAPKHTSGDSGGTGSPASAETKEPSASGAATMGGARLGISAGGNVSDCDCPGEGSSGFWR